MYIVTVDTDDDQSYTTDITNDVLMLNWRLGMAKPYDLIAAPSIAQITLRNTEQTYSPESTPDLLTVGRRLKIANGETLFIGFIREVRPAAGEFGERITIVRVTGAEEEYASVTVAMPLQVNVTADEVLENVFAVEPLTRIPTEFETGIGVLSYVGDLWGDGVSAKRVIREVVEAERGRFFYDRTGQAVFYNRHHLLSNLTIEETFSDDMAGLNYAYGKGIINTVRVRVRPRSIGAAGSVVWVLENAQLLRPDVPRTIIARLYDNQGQRVGILEVIEPEAYTDYSANTQADGSGTDVTGEVAMTVQSIAGGSVKLRLENTHDESVYLQPGSQLRGTPIYPGDSVLVEQVDEDAQLANGAHTLTLSLPALDSIEDADQIAVYELTRRVDPQGAVLTLILNEHNRLEDGLALTLFDRIQITEAQTDHSGQYFVVAEAHEVTRGGYQHKITLTLEPVSPVTYWVLDESAFDDETRLGY